MSEIALITELINSPENASMALGADGSERERKRFHEQLHRNEEQKVAEERQWLILPANLMNA